MSGCNHVALVTVCHVVMVSVEREPMSYHPPPDAAAPPAACLTVWRLHGCMKAAITHYMLSNVHQGFSQEGFISALWLRYVCDPSGPLFFKSNVPCCFCEEA